MTTLFLSCTVSKPASTEIRIVNFGDVVRTLGTAQKIFVGAKCFRFVWDVETCCVEVWYTKTLTSHPASISNTFISTYDNLSNFFSPRGRSGSRTDFCPKIQNHDLEYCTVSTCRGLKSWKHVSGLCTLNVNSRRGPVVSHRQILLQARKLAKTGKIARNRHTTRAS